MPRTKQDRKPPVDLLKAVILERKLVYGLTYEDLAESAKINATYLRKLMSKTNTDEWSPDVRRAVCRALGINIQTTLSLVSDAGIRIN